MVGQEELFIFTKFNWYSVPEQLRSVAKLLHYDWLHVLPGTACTFVMIVLFCYEMNEDNW